MSELSDRLRPSWAFDEALAGVVRELRLSHRHASANAANQYIVESNALRRLAAAELDAQSKLLAETVEVLITLRDGLRSNGTVWVLTGNGAERERGPGYADFIDDALTKLTGASK